MSDEKISNTVRTIIAMARSYARKDPYPKIEFIWTDQEMIDLAQKKILKLIEAS